MKNKVLFAAAFAIGCLFISSSLFSQTEDKATEIKWYTWSEAIEANKETPKKMFIDMYTDWCGWCKKMDASTFKDPRVVEYMNENFYAIKFDAERKDEIIYDNHSFNFVKNGRRGYHQLAAALLDGKMGYPSFVYMDEEERRITVSPGYKDAKTLLIELEFIGKNHYQRTDYKTFAKKKSGAR
ncbi:MAG: DUF255 domain-containing protein [Bacteroidota bacterium]